MQQNRGSSFVFHQQFLFIFVSPIASFSQLRQLVGCWPPSTIIRHSNAHNTIDVNIAKGHATANTLNPISKNTHNIENMYSPNRGQQYSN